ncbi:MAG: C-GCAxxG-C-C family protein [Desulfurococcaceae archaeon]|nr:C-GCAxxG-C-C family protein [Desulfurococcaceae archaeon]
MYLDENRKKALAEKAGALAERYEITYHGCSQSTLKAIQDVLSEVIVIGNGNAFKAASSLAAGVARSGEVCGALLGALMAVSLVFGRDKLEPTAVSEGYKKAMEVSYKVFDEFKEFFGSVRCRDIQMKLFGKYYNLRNPLELDEFFSSGNANKCGEVTKIAAKIATKAILENLTK